MINRLVLAGRITRGPQPTGDTLTLTLELQHTTLYTRTQEPACSVEVQFVGARIVEIGTKYFRNGEDLLVEGYLQERGGKLVVIGESFSFLPRDVQRRCFWVDELAHQAA